MALSGLPTAPTAPSVADLGWDLAGSEHCLVQTSRGELLQERERSLGGLTYVLTYLRNYKLTCLRNYARTYLRNYVLTYLRTYQRTYVHGWRCRDLPSHVRAWVAVKRLANARTYVGVCIGTYQRKYMTTWGPLVACFVKIG